MNRTENRRDRHAAQDRTIHAETTREPRVGLGTGYGQRGARWRERGCDERVRRKCDALCRCRWQWPAVYRQTNVRRPRASRTGIRARLRRAVAGQEVVALDPALREVIRDV